MKQASTVNLGLRSLIYVQKASSLIVIKQAVCSVPLVSSASSVMTSQ